MNLKTEITKKGSVTFIKNICAELSFELKIPLIIIIALLICGRPFSLYAVTILSGIPEGTTELILANSPYIIEKDLIIEKGHSLVIQAGCNLFFTSFTGIVVHGNLTVNGSDEHPVLFSSVNDTLSPQRTTALPNPFDWNGILITSMASSIVFSNSILKFSTYGIKSQTESLIIKNGYFKNNGQYHCTINDKVELVTDGIPFRYIHCKIMYNANQANDGTVPVDTTNYSDEAAIQVKDNSGNLVRTGYTFAGWNTMPDGSGSAFTPGNKYQIDNSNMILYANWITNKKASLTKRYIVPGSVSGLSVASGVVSMVFLSKWLNKKDEYSNANGTSAFSQLQNDGKVFSGVSLSTGAVSLIGISTAVILFIRNNRTTTTATIQNSPQLSVGVNSISLVYSF